MIFACNDDPRRVGSNLGSMRVLVVEDDKDVAGFLVRGLSEATYTVEHVESGSDGLWLATIEAFDAIVLDCMLPGGIDGLAILESLRAQNNLVPVLILSALAEVDERVRGLNAGAGDYLTKPFDFAELLARVRALSRRRGSEPREDRRFCREFSCDADSTHGWWHRFRWDGRR
jgi:two-component system OmpR family response regulator